MAQPLHIFPFVRKDLDLNSVACCSHTLARGNMTGLSVWSVMEQGFPSQHYKRLLLRLLSMNHPSNRFCFVKVRARVKSKLEIPVKKRPDYIIGFTPSWGLDENFLNVKANCSCASSIDRIALSYEIPLKTNSNVFNTYKANCNAVFSLLYSALTVWLPFSSRSPASLSFHILFRLTASKTGSLYFLG